MSATLFAASAIVIVACIGFVIVGAVYKWDVAASGYSRWTRVVGVVAVLGLAAVTAWDRIEEPLTAAVIMTLGIALAIGYVLLHRRLSARVRDMLGPRDAAR